MRYSETTTLSLGTILSQASDPPQSPTQSTMLKSKCGSIGSLKKIATSSSSSSKNLPPPSPTTSVSESNVIASSSDFEHNPTSNPSPSTNTLLQSLKFEDNLDVEVQSPDNNSIWDSLFSDQIIDPSTDFMLISSPRRDFLISSPKRDYMVSSPRRDYMVSSPRRDYMISSPKRDYMVSSPKRDYMVTVTSPKRMGMGMNNASMYGHNCINVHGMHGYENSTSAAAAAAAAAAATTSNLAYSSKGQSPSPLHKVFNNSTIPNNYSIPTQYGVMDTLLMDDYGVYSNMKGECPNEIFDVAGPPPTETAVGGMTATLLECLSMPSLDMDKYGDGMGVGVQLSGDHDHGHGHDGVNGHHHGYGMSEIGGRRYQVECGGLMGAGGATTKTEMGDGSSYHGFLGSSIGCDHTEQDHDSGLQLVNLLLACAESVAKDEYISARRHLHHLQRTISPHGDSMQRVASCFADALSSRLSPPVPSAPHCPSLDTLKIYQILYQACPYIKFAHFTANQAILEAFESEDRVHIIDLDILQGYQWPAFLQAIAARPGGPPSLRITGVGYPAELVRETGRHLTELAHSLRVPFEFHPAVADRLQDLRPHMLHRRVGEALAVNSVNRLHRVPGAHLGNLLSMIRDQAPNIVTLVEQEASHNVPHFLGRFLEALHYYSAIFDSLDATFPSDSAARAKVEQYIFLPEIRNIVACEGPARIERHERLERWRKVMEGRGFKGVPLGQNAVAQSKILLGLYSCEGYRLTEDMGCLLLGWQDRPLIAASAWRC